MGEMLGESPVHGSLILALIRQVVLWAAAQGIFIWLATKGIFPQQWFATLLGLTLTTTAWDAPTLIISGLFAFIATVAWEMAGIQVGC